MVRKPSTSNKSRQVMRCVLSLPDAISLMNLSIPAVTPPLMGGPQVEAGSQLSRVEDKSHRGWWWLSEGTCVLLVCSASIQ